MNWLPEKDSQMSLDMNEEELYCVSDTQLNGLFFVSIVVDISLVITGNICKFITC